MWLVLTAMVMTMAAGCRRPAEPRLAVADSLMATQPDSAFALLKAIDSRELNGDDQAYFALLYTAAQYKNYDPITSDSLIDIAVGHYRSSDDYDKWLRSMIFKGAALEETGDRLGAIEWYKKAEAATDSTDYENLGYVNMRLGRLYMESYIENHEDIEKYKNALRYYRLSGNRKYELTCLGAVGALYRGFDMDSAYAYIDKSVRLSRELGDSANVYYHLGLLARAYLVDSLPLKAKDVAVTIIKNGGKDITDSDVYFDAANAYVQLNMLDSASYYYENRPRNDHSPNRTVIELIFKTSFYLAQGKYAEAYEANRRCTVLADSIADSNNKMQLFELEKRYDKELVELERSRTLWIVCLSFAGFLMSIFFVWKYAKNRSQLREAYMLRDKI